MRNYFFNQNTITFLISLLLASIFWILIKLSGDFETEQKAKIKYLNLPVDKVMINKPDSVLYFSTNNNGFDLLKQMILNRNKTITINFDKAKYLQTKSDIKSYYIITNSLDQEIKYEFESNNEILNIKPDSLIFAFEKLASKKMKIELDLDLNFDPRFKQYKEIKAEPEMIEIFGPSSLLDSLQSIKTQKLSLNKINSNVDTVVKLLLPDEQFLVKNNKVRILMAVEEFTEGQIKIPIQLKASANLHYKVFPSEALITYQVALKDFANIDPRDFELRATRDTTGAGRLQLQLSKQPDNVIVSNIQPSTAEYIILK